MITSTRGVSSVISVHGIARVCLWGPRPVIAGAPPSWWPSGVPFLELAVEEVVHNLITDGGLGWIVDRLAASPAQAPLSHMELGRVGTPPIGSNTTLLNPIVGSRKAITEVAAVQPGGKLRFLTFWDRGEATDPNVAEAGDFNAPVLGTMIGRIAFGPFDKTAEHIMTVERIWTFTRG